MQFIRGRVGEVTDWAMTPEEEGKLVIRVEDTLAGFVRRIPVDMVVLATGLEPQADAQDVRRMFNMSCGTRRLLPGAASQAGAGEHLHRRHLPRRLPARGRGTSPTRSPRRAPPRPRPWSLIDKGYIEQEPNTAYILDEECSGCKSCIPLCPYTAITFDEATAEGGHQRGALQGLRHLRGLLPVRLDRPAPVRRRGDLQRNRRSSGL